MSTRQDVAALMDWLLETDARLQGLTRKLHLRQGRLKGALNRVQYALYLRLEETANDRCIELAERLYAIARSGVWGPSPPVALPKRRAEPSGYRIRWSKRSALFEAWCDCPASPGT